MTLPAIVLPAPRMRLIDYLQSRTTDYSPRVHGNGFIQLDITPTVRLHLWGDARIPRQRVATPIHDHAFGFTSRVVLGSLNQRVMHLAPASESDLFAAEALVYQPHRVRLRHGEDTGLQPDGAPVVVTGETNSFHGGYGDERDVYRMDPGEFHETIPMGVAASVIVKRGRTLSQGGTSPTVLVPLGRQPDNHFNRHAALAFGDLWTVVRDVTDRDPEAIAAGILWALTLADDTPLGA